MADDAERFGHSPAVAGYNSTRAGTQGRSEFFVIEESCNLPGEILGIAHVCGTAAIDQELGDVAEVLHMMAKKNGDSAAGRLDDVMAPDRNQTAPYKSNRSLMEYGCDLADRVDQ